MGVCFRMSVWLFFVVCIIESALKKLKIKLEKSSVRPLLILFNRHRIYNGSFPEELTINKSFEIGIGK